MSWLRIPVSCRWASLVVTWYPFCRWSSLVVLDVRDVACVFVDQDLMYANHSCSGDDEALEAGREHSTSTQGGTRVGGHVYADVQTCMFVCVCLRDMWVGG